MIFDLELRNQQAFTYLIRSLVEISPSSSIPSNCLKWANRGGYLNRIHGILSDYTNNSIMSKNQVLYMKTCHLKILYWFPTKVQYYQMIQNNHLEKSIINHWPLSSWTKNKITMRTKVLIWWRKASIRMEKWVLW